MKECTHLFQHGEAIERLRVIVGQSFEVLTLQNNKVVITLNAKVGQFFCSMALCHNIYFILFFENVSVFALDDRILQTMHLTQYIVCPIFRWSNYARGHEFMPIHPHNAC